MKVKFLAAVLVTWKVAGTVVIPCEKGQSLDPIVGYCVAPLDVTRSQQFDKLDMAEDFAKKVKAYKIDGVKISEVRIYSEQGVK